MLSDWLVNHWYREKASWLALILTPLECLYRILLHNKTSKDLAKQAANSSVGIPVVVVGNITVGGVGKTPVVLALAEHLKSKGYRPGIVSRGYKGESQQFPLSVTATTNPKLAGDEPVLLASLSGCPVVVDPNRPNAVKALVEQYDVDVVLADDGLQHYALARDIEIVVIDGVRGLGNQHCLPAGPLREPAERLSKADFILINGGNYQVEGGERFVLSADEVKPVGSDNSVVLDTSKKVHAVAGIGNPNRFFATLQQLGYDFIEHRFPDHHHFQAEDLNFGDELPIVMTEKDAVKCQSLELKNGYYLPVRAELPQTFLASFDQQLNALSNS